MSRRKKPSLTSFENLLRKIRIQFEELGQYSDFLDAMRGDGFKHGEIKSEPFYWACHPQKPDSPAGILCHEILTQPITRENKALKMQAVSDQAMQTGSSMDMDSVIIRKILDQLDLENTDPIAVNISGQSALSKRFFTGKNPGLGDVLGDINPELVLFEIQEHDVPKNANARHLEELTKAGFRFILDDHLSIPDGQSKKQAKEMHQRRLDVFGPYVSIIKLDGPDAVTKGYESAESMDALHEECERLLRFNPDFLILAEHVQTFEESLKLPPSINLLQGKYLSEDAYNKFIEEQSRNYCPQQNAASSAEPFPKGEEGPNIEPAR